MVASEASSDLRASHLPEPLVQSLTRRLGDLATMVCEIALAREQPLDCDVFIEGIPVNASGAELILGELLRGSGK
jgi:hypothetical protein